MLTLLECLSMFSSSAVVVSHLALAILRVVDHI